MATSEQAVWNALLEMEPSLARMEEPDVPSLTAKFLTSYRSGVSYSLPWPTSKPPAAQSINI